MKIFSLISYAIFIFLFALFSYLFIDPNFFYLQSFYTGFFQLHRGITTALFLLSIIIFFAFYFYFLHLPKSETINKKIIIIIGIPVVLFLFSYPAMLSFDIFNYIATAKVTFFYHENPYLIMPIELSNDPILRFMHAANKTALYAPFWILLTGIPYFFGLGNFLFTLFQFKLFTILFYLATIFLIWKMTKSSHKVLFFACNPLVIIETLVSGHNDISMMFLFLLGIYFIQSEKRIGALSAYILSIGIKYATGVLLPFLPFLLFKKLPKDQLFLWSTILMLVIFLLSPLREEIYPWYALWFLTPGTFLIDNKIVKYFLVSISFGLLLRYIPFMFFGTYFGPTPLLKILLMMLPIFTIATWFGLQYLLHKKI